MIQGEYNTYVSDEGTTNVISGSMCTGYRVGTNAALKTGRRSIQIGSPIPGLIHAVSVKILPVLLLLSVLTSCALAQPEAESGDQFAGLYVVPGSPV